MILVLSNEQERSSVMRIVTGSLFSLCMGSGGFEANRVDEIVEGLDDPLVQLVELR
jgi:hypothetical protein